MTLNVVRWRKWNLLSGARERDGWAGGGQGWASQVVLVVKNPPANAGDVREVGSVPRLGRSPGGGRAWRSTLVFLPGGSYEQRSLVGYSPSGCKQSDMIEAT